MPRGLSPTAIASGNTQETSEVWLILVTISHASLASPIRVVNNNEDITSRGLLYLAFPFQIILPGEDPDSVSKAVLRFDNADRTAIAAIRGLDTAPSVSLEVILARRPDIVEISFPGLMLRNATYDAFTIEGELYFEALVSEPITYSMTPSRFPGLF